MAEGKIKVLPKKKKNNPSPKIGNKNKLLKSFKQEDWQDQICSLK